MPESSPSRSTTDTDISGAAPAAAPPPRPPSRFSARQSQILDQLEAIVVQEGFRHLTVERLAARLRCSRRTLYELAESKDELVLVVLDRLLRRMGRRANEQVQGSDDPVERVQAFMAAAIKEIRALSLTVAEDIDRWGPARRLFDAHYEYAAGVLGGMIQKGIDQGAFRPVHAQLVAQVLDAGIARMQQPRVLRTLGVTEAEAFTQLTSIILHGITAPTS